MTFRTARRLFALADQCGWAVYSMQWQRRSGQMIPTRKCTLEHPVHEHPGQEHVLLIVEHTFFGSLFGKQTFSSAGAQDLWWLDSKAQVRSVIETRTAPPGAAPFAAHRH